MSFVGSALVLAVGMTVISGVLSLLGVETRPLRLLLPTGLVYCVVFSACYASAEVWRGRRRDKQSPPE